MIELSSSPIWLDQLSAALAAVFNEVYSVHRSCPLVTSVTKARIDAQLLRGMPMFQEKARAIGISIDHVDSMAIEMSAIQVDKTPLAFASASASAPVAQASSASAAQASSASAAQASSASASAAQAPSTQASSASAAQASSAQASSAFAAQTHRFGTILIVILLILRYIFANIGMKGVSLTCDTATAKIDELLISLNAPAQLNTFKVKSIIHTRAMLCVISLMFGFVPAIIVGFWLAVEMSIETYRNFVSNVQADAVLETAAILAPPAVPSTGGVRRRSGDDGVVFNIEDVGLGVGLGPSSRYSVRTPARTSIRASARSTDRSSERSSKSSVPVSQALSADEQRELDELLRDFDRQ